MCVRRKYHPGGEITNSENDYKKPEVAKLREGGGCTIRKVSKVFD